MISYLPSIKIKQLRDKCLAQGYLYLCYRLMEASSPLTPLLHFFPNSTSHLSFFFYPSSLHPSIHPSIRLLTSAHPESSHRGSEVGYPRHPYHQQSFLDLLEAVNAFPGQMKYRIPSAHCGSTPGSPSSWARPENLQREALWRHPNQKPKSPKPALFDTKEQCSTMSFLWRTEHLKAESSYSLKETHFSCLYPRYHSFSY